MTAPDRDTEWHIRQAQEGRAESCDLIDRLVGAGDLPWSAQRRTGLGGSDVGAALGLSPFKRPIDVWREKMGMDAGFTETEPMRWGTLLEPVVADDYASRHGVELLEVAETMRDSFRPWHLATIDRLAPGRRLVEIKCRGIRARGGYGEPGTGEIPAPDYTQIAWYMHAVDAADAVQVVLWGGQEIAEYPIRRDMALERGIIESADQWWKDHVIAEVEPGPDGSDAYWSHLAETEVSGDIREPRESELDLLASLRAAETGYRRAKEVRESIRQRVAAAIGDGAGIALESGKVTYREQAGRVIQSKVIAALCERAGVDKKALAELEAAHRGKPTRVLRTPRAWAKDGE